MTDETEILDIASVFPDLKERQLNVLKLIQSDPGMTQIEMARILGVSRQAINKIISRLQDKGIVSKDKNEQGSLWMINLTK